MAVVNWSLQHFSDTAANMTANNPVLLEGQIGIETDGLTTTPKFKIGDGSTAWNTLPYFYGGASSAQNLNNVLGVGSSTSGRDMTITADDQIKMGAGNAVIFNDSTETDSNHIFLATNSAISGYSHIFLKDGGNEFHDESANAYISLQAGSPPSCSISFDHTNNGKINIFTGLGGLNLQNDTYLNGLTASTVPYLDANNKITSSAVTPTELGLLSGLTGFTGSGTLLAKGTSPTFTTDITTPLIIGGSAVGSTIQYKGTSGNGTSTVAAHQFLVGNNGATTAAQIFNSGQVSIGNYASPTNLRALTVGQDTAFATFGSYTSLTSSFAFYVNQATPGASNYTMLWDVSSNIYLNAPASAGVMYFRVNNTTIQSVANTSLSFSPQSATSGSVTNFTFTASTNTGQTASTEISNFKVNGASKTWAAGAITTQRWNYFTANTAAFASASTITNSYGLYVEAATAGTNATITNNYAAGFSGGAQFIVGTVANAGVLIRDLVGDSTYGALYMGVTPSSTNYTVASKIGLCAIANDTQINLNIGGFRKMFVSSAGITLDEASNVATGTTTGTKFGASTSQKIGFWNATPIVQPTTAVAAATFVANTSGIANDTATFDGYTIGQVVKALRNCGLLA